MEEESNGTVGKFIGGEESHQRLKTHKIQRV